MEVLVLLLLLGTIFPAGTDFVQKGDIVLAAYYGAFSAPDIAEYLHAHLSLEGLMKKIEKIPSPDVVGADNPSTLEIILSRGILNRTYETDSGIYDTRDDLGIEDMPGAKLIKVIKTRMHRRWESFENAPDRKGPVKEITFGRPFFGGDITGAGDKTADELIEESKELLKNYPDYLYKE